MVDFFETRVENLEPKKAMKKSSAAAKNSIKKAKKRKREDSKSSVVESSKKSTEACYPSKKLTYTAVGSAKYGQLIAK